MSPRIPSARVHTSGPDQALLTTRLSNGDRIRMGRVQPMAELPVSRWEARAVCAVVALSAAAVAVFGVWS